MANANRRKKSTNPNRELNARALALVGAARALALAVEQKRRAQARIDALIPGADCPLCGKEHGEEGPAAEACAADFRARSCVLHYRYDCEVCAAEKELSPTLTTLLGGKP